MVLLDNHIFIGLLLDAAISKLSSEYLIDAHNIRITARNSETLMSITNEKGPRELTLKNSLGSNVPIVGTILGHCVLNNYLVLFTHQESGLDIIYRIDMSEENPILFTLFLGQLNFDEEHPIETLGDYENENIQKVYWTDGKNLPRVINIVKENYKWEGAFDFVPTLQLKETITVEKHNSGGSFPSGVILYAFTYYNKYGQESNIFYTTPLNYISYYDRGGSPEDIISNSFTITIKGIDSHFDYLRIYSIMRTSINGTPVCKRILDIALDSIDKNSVSYIDTGTSGESIDPTELLYKGGEAIIANNLCSKDGTIFLGNITIDRPNIKNVVSSTGYNVSSLTKAVYATLVSSSPYHYLNGLNTQAAGFKSREYYRIGYLALYENGKWSEPIWIKDVLISTANGSSDFALTMPTLWCTIDSEITTALYEAKYKRVRPLVVFPTLQDRTIVFQGIANPTLYTSNNRTNNEGIYAQSSWFFRPYNKNTSITGEKNLVNIPYSAVTGSTLPYADAEMTSEITKIRSVEILGNYDSGDKFKIDWLTVTINSPEITFDENYYNLDLSGTEIKLVGRAIVSGTMSDMEMQTSSPTISNGGAGFTHKSFSTSDNRGIISGLFYEDFLVDDYDNGQKYRAYDKERSPYKWMVYLWNKSGSLNNDINRPEGTGTRSSVLSKKVISNLRYTTTTYFPSANIVPLSNTAGSPQIFYSNEASIAKFGSYIYMGNIDTMLSPSKGSGLYFAFDSADYGAKNISTALDSINWWKTWSLQEDTSDNNGLYKYVSGGTWEKRNKDIGDYSAALTINREAVRMRYKSTPHAVARVTRTMPGNYFGTGTLWELPIVEVTRKYDASTMFGGQTPDALRANTWIPAGEPVNLVSGQSATIKYEYGDTWYSRYDCLKTYPFTSEDINLVVEIGSFMLETRVNIDGRYDRNRGQLNNTNMSPTNFNLLNPVYSLQNNFFTYSILDDDYYLLNRFPNLIAWSTAKTEGSDVDPWTSVTLASTYSLDGSKGLILALKVWSNNIYCFLDSGVSNLLFNSRVLIPTSDGVPIEVANNYKVEGKRYLSDGIGCINKYSICTTPSTLYFIDSVSGHLLAINSNGIADVSVLKNMVTWLANKDTSMWKPTNFTFRTFYDKNNNDLYIVTKDEALCYSEILNLFTSFMSYEDIPIMFNVVNKFYCVKDNYLNEMFTGDYNYFFDEYKDFDITFISNGKNNNNDLTTLDKIFNNIDFRADKWSDKLDSILSLEPPFDYIRVWNEYQDTGEVLLNWKTCKPSNLKKKFRVWRIQVPRDAHNRIDRIRNTWCKIKLGCAARYNNGNCSFTLLHDVGVQYFI